MTVHAAKVEVVGLGKEFGRQHALRGVTLTVEPGTFLVLLGPSGSGKTTLLRCIAGIERPSGGTIALNGRVVSGGGRTVGPEDRDLAMVFQDYALWPHLTVAKNVRFPLTAKGTASAERDRRVGQLLARVGLAHHASKFPNELSGGEQQRVALARALATDAGLMLFDEPLSNLDADRREALRVEIATVVRETGTTAIYITHDQAEAFALADTVAVMRDGAIEQIGRPEAIYQSPSSAFVARFTGISGELAATVESSSGGEGIVTIAGCRIERVRCTVDAGAPAVAMLRPAGLAITADGGLTGVVDDCAFVGRGYECVVTVGAAGRLVKVFSSGPLVRGSTVRLHVDPASCFVFPADREEQR